MCALQPLQLREPMHSLLLAMCEDQPRRRRPLQAVLEACRVHQEEVAVYPAPASLHISRLVGLVLGTISEVERRVVEEGTCERQSRSHFLRSKLHQAGSESPGARASDGLQPQREDSVLLLMMWEHRVAAESVAGWMHHQVLYPSSFLASTFAGVGPCDCEEGLQRDSGPMLLTEAEKSQPATSPRNFLQRKGKFSRPEFILLAGEAPVTLHLPGSIVTKKGKSYLAFRDLCVVLLNGQCLEVKCDMESTAGAVFNAVMSFTNLGETTYFGLAYMKGEEFFFLDKDTRLCKVAPEGWREQHPKGSMDTLTLFLRIKFFVSHYGLLRHSLTRHQFYLQLRKDILEERLYCNDETLLQLGVLALQAEFGSYPKEQLERKAYFQIQDYIPARLIERMTAIRVQVEISEMHRLSSAPWGEDAELEFLEVVQQLPEYGVLVHRVFPEKKRPEGKMALGVCAKGIIVYEVKSSRRIATSQFPWRETGMISTHRRKFTITSSITGKKYTFVTDSAKTCKYLLGLCSAQHWFNAQMGSEQPPHLLSDRDKFVQIANLNSAHQTQANPLTWIQKLSCSENELCVPRLPDATGGRLSTSMENVQGGKEIKMEGIRSSPYCGREQPDSISSSQKSTRHLSGAVVQSTGFVINEGEDVDQAKPGIFISSLIPGGPAEKAKMIKPGGKILALNHISLEGFTFNMAVRMIQNSPDNIELIISQSKGRVFHNASGASPNISITLASRSLSLLDATVLTPLSEAAKDWRIPGKPRVFSSHCKAKGRYQKQEKKVQKVSSATFPWASTCRPRSEGASNSEERLTPRLTIPGNALADRPRDGPLLAAGYCPSFPLEAKVGEIYFVDLVKEDGTLGFSVTGGINTSVPHGGIFVKSIIPGGPAAKEGQILQGKGYVLLAVLLSVVSIPR
ncbi:FERM and PDZ domain-containing protein 2 isoform X1 [Cricetulus griseus]|uniref:FERM and PDZ domain-containing protein 2 isoform X1 n=1 Tax=Cricetulus griseus TaxID=10029 RepID=UPI0015C3CE14|nr:FERM and PDZ domain-containing protein 2 isoform X1 [Cricetulus griseus]